MATKAYRAPGVPPPPAGYRMAPVGHVFVRGDKVYIGYWKALGDIGKGYRVRAKDALGFPAGYYCTRKKKGGTA